MLTLLILASLTRVRNLLSKTRLILPLLALASYGILWTIAGRDTLAPVVFAARVGFLGLVYLSALELMSTGMIGLRWIAAVPWVVLATVVSSQIVGRIVGVTYVYKGEFVFPGLTGEPALLATSALAILPFFFVQTPLRVTGALGALVGCVAIAATQRRSAIVAAVAMFGVYGAMSFVTPRKRFAFRFAGLLVGLLGTLYLIADATPLGRDLAVRFDDINFATGGTGSGRVEFQRIAFERIVDRDAAAAMFGEGFGALREALGETFGLAIGGHNDWIDLVYACGAVGGVLFLWFHLELVRLILGLHGASRTIAWMTMAGMAVLELTAGGALSPSCAPMFALFGILRATQAHKARAPQCPSARRNVDARGMTW